jgi:hypothetical protein
MTPTAMRRRRSYHVHGRSVISSVEDFVRYHDESVVTGSSSPFAQDIITASDVERVIGFSNVEYSVDSYGTQDADTIYQDGIPGGTDQRTFNPDAAVASETAAPSAIDDHFVVDAAVVAGSAVPSSTQTYDGVQTSTATSISVPSAAEHVDSITAQTATGTGVPSSPNNHSFTDAATITKSGVPSSVETFTRVERITTTGTAVPSSVNSTDRVDSGTVAGTGFPAVVYVDSSTLVTIGFIDSVDNYNVVNDTSEVVSGQSSMFAAEIPAIDFDTVSGLGVMSSVVAFGRSDQTTIVAVSSMSSTDTSEHTESGTSGCTVVPSSTDHADYIDSGTASTTVQPIGTLDLQGYDIGIYNFSVYDFGPGSGDGGMVIGVATGNISGADVYQPSASGTFISAAEQYNSGTVTNTGPDLVDRFAMSFAEWYNNQLPKGTGVPSSTESYTPGGGATSFTIGKPANWGKLISAGGHRPSLTSYVQEPGITFGPGIAYYNNASARSKLRASTIRNDLVYYPRSLGADITAIQAGSNFAVTLAKSVSIAPGTTVKVSGLTGKASQNQQLKPSPNGTYTVKTSSGTSLVFNEPWQGTGVYDTSQPGYIAWIAKNDTVYEVVVTPSNVSTLHDATDGTPLFTLSGGYWTWNGGKCHRFIISGSTACDPAFKLRFPSNFDVINPSPAYTSLGVDCDPQLLNPFTCFDITNCTIDFQGGSVQGSTGGTAAYSVNIGGMYIPNGQGCSYSGIAGTIKGMLNYGYSYDANKVGGGCAGLNWLNCFNYRNTQVPRGSHTDCYQVADLDNTSLGSTPTWQYCFFQSGGNSMEFLNDEGQATKLVANVVADHCIAWIGNKFGDYAGCQDSGARSCWINDDDNVQVRPEPLDFGTGVTTHPFPRNTVVWPANNNANANLAVDALGNTSSTAPHVQRPALPLVHRDTNGNIDATSTFTFVN